MILLKKTVSVFAVVLILILSVFAVSADAAVMAVPEPAEPAPESAEQTVPVKGEISIVVLGDSIARGYGLENVESERFSAVLGEKLSNKYADVAVSNYAVDGITGAELTEMLKTEPPSELATADYILISIGGNNVLRYLSDMNEINALLSGVVPGVFVDYFRYLLADTEEERNASDYARETLDTLFGTINGIMKGERMESVIDTAVRKLDSEIPELVEYIRKSNSDGKIFIQTIYNPYKDMVVSLKAVRNSVNLSDFGENAVSALNRVIESHAAEYGYNVVPVHEGFEASSKRLTNAGFDILNAVFGLDPHPTREGHALIAEIYYKMITEE